MAILQLLIITCALIAHASPNRDIDIANIVHNKYLGNIGNPTERNILKKLLEKNTDLPQELRGTSTNSRALYVSPIYPDGRALINVQTGTANYAGFVEVYFNGGQPIDPTVHREKINLSLITNTYLANLRNPTDDQIKQAFLSNNPNLQRLNKNMLSIRRYPNERKASLYVENYSGFEGHAIVTW